MRLFFISLWSALLFLAPVIKATAEITDVGAYSPVISLGTDLTLQVSQSPPHLAVQSDGYIHFQLEVPELGDDYFSRHHLQINFPYFANGYRKNHYIEVSKSGLVPVSIPSEEPVGTPIYLYNGDRRFVKSTAEWLVTPIIQYFMVQEMLNQIGRFGDVSPYGPSIDFKNGGFLEGAQGYLLLDSSLRLARDTAEHLEVYYQLDPGASTATVVVIFAAGAFVLNDVPIDATRYTALAMQKSSIYSVIAGKMVEGTDELLITPKLSERLFPSHGSVRNFRSRLTSQMVRGPILSAGLSTLDLLDEGDELPALHKERVSDNSIAKPVSDMRQSQFVSPAKWLITKKLMIKSASETRQLNEMLGQGIEGALNRIIEWGMNIATVKLTGIDGPSGSLKQTFTDEFQQQLGSHTLKQIKTVKDKRVMEPLMVNQPLIHLVVNQVLMNFAIGGLIYMMADSIDKEMGGNGMVSGRYGKGAGLAFATKTIGSCAIEWVTGCATELVYDNVAGISPWIASFFRRDYLVEFGHGLTPEPESKQDSGWRSHAVHDEL